MHGKLDHLFHTHPHTIVSIGQGTYRYAIEELISAIHGYSLHKSCSAGPVLPTSHLLNSAPFEVSINGGTPKMDGLVYSGESING